MNTRRIFIAASCLAINLTLAKSASLLGLPVYLDSTGSILAAAILPLPMALTVGIATSLLGGVVISPYFAAYFLTQATVVLVAATCVRSGLMRTWWGAIISGLLVAASAVIVSAPVTAILFGGVALSSTTAVNAILIASGKGIWKSVMAGSAIIESIDKPVTALLTWLVLRRLPADLIGSVTATPVTTER
jgi:energy-coupling factor transport system substrate-specific component